MLLLLLRIQSALSSALCPCDVSQQCDVNCCCDLTCSDVLRASFTCTNYTSGLPSLCCSTKTLYSESTQTYSDVRSCSTDILCLNAVPSSFGQFEGQGAVLSDQSFEQQSSNTLTSSITPAHTSPYYKPSDYLLYYQHNTTLSHYSVPVSLLGETCLKSPLMFGKDISSSCSTNVDISTHCKSGTFLDYKTYLTEYLLSYPSSTNYIDLTNSNKISVLCENAEGRRASCSEKEIDHDVPGRICSNVMREVVIELQISNSTMIIVDGVVIVVLAKLDSTVTKWTQHFKLSYKNTLDENTEVKSGSFGYVTGSNVLAGVRAGVSVEMGSDPETWLTLFQSDDCENFKRVPVTFGVNEYYGCLLSLPFYNNQFLSHQVSSNDDYCHLLGNYTKGVLSGHQPSLIGKTGASSVEDITQWVTVVQNTLAVPPVEGLLTQCYNIKTGTRLEIYYSDVGERSNRQSVIISTKLVHIVQDIQLLCGGVYCSTSINANQQIIISNSVQFIYQIPSIVERYKVKPKASILVPYDFFYPFSSRGYRNDYSIMLLLVILLSFLTF